MHRPVFYEVNIKVGDSVKMEFLRWLKTHIAEMEEITGFRKRTEIFAESGKQLSLSIRYHLDSMPALNAYFENHADRMRGDLPEHLKSHLMFDRRILYKFELI